ncbi:MAG: hypothetical protein M1820_008319 [Bogoriella megaspora]|nr:MAG: hypothetical protein M1820_008319 [Bogoriella megaspora]
MTQPIPFLDPPAGQTSNFEHPDTLSIRSTVAIAISLPLITLFFLLRSYVRLRVKRTWILEDWFVAIAWAGTVAYSGLVAATFSHHGGEHAWDITKEQAKQAAYWFNIATIEYALIICATKLAVLWLYRRVFSPVRYSVFDLSIIGLSIIVTIFYVTTFFIKIFECTPRAKIVDKSISGTCMDTAAILNASGLFNTITDIVILLLPIKAVWTLNVKTEKKIVVVLVFTFGSFAPIFSLIGFVFRLIISGNPDTTWNQPVLLLWALAELTAGVLCVCFPEMAVLVRRKDRQPTGSSFGQNAMSQSGRRSNHHQTIITHPKKSTMRARRDSYLELEENETYGVRVTPTRNHSLKRDLGGVQVTEEIIIESEDV